MTCFLASQAHAGCHAWRRISDYVNYIEGLEAVEEDDTACVDNRLLLEKAWQIIANEFYDAKGHFSQASWAEQLLSTLKVIACLSAHCSNLDPFSDLLNGLASLSTDSKKLQYYR